jgi:hypothetical protein
LDFCVDVKSNYKVYYVDQKSTLSNFHQVSFRVATILLYSKTAIRKIIGFRKNTAECGLHGAIDREEKLVLIFVMKLDTMQYHRFEYERN